MQQCLKSVYPNVALRWLIRERLGITTPHAADAEPEADMTNKFQKEILKRKPHRPTRENSVVSGLLSVHLHSALWSLVSLDSRHSRGV